MCCFVSPLYIDASSLVDKDSIFRIGSISKVFTMLSLMILRDRGKLSLDDEISTHVPLFVEPINPWKSAKDKRRGITFRQLATHLSGLSRESPCSGSPDGGVPGTCSMSDEEAFRRIGMTQLILEHDRLPVYSNLGFDVLGHALATVHGGGSYESMVDELVIRPLGLLNTGVNITQANRSLLAMPYLDPTVRQAQEASSSSTRGGRGPRASRRPSLSPPRLWHASASPPSGKCRECLNDFGWSNPSGAMFSTVQDLLQIAKLVFHEDPLTTGEDTPPALLESGSVRETLMPHFTNGDGSGFGLTWELYKVGRYTLRTKRGDVDGYASELIMIPELRLGWVVLANTVEHAQDTAQTMTNILIPAFEAWVHTHPLKEDSAPLPLEAYVGTYIPGPGNSPGMNQSTVIRLDPSGQYLLYSLTVPALMEYSPQASTTNIHVFRLRPWPGIEGGAAGASCFNTQMDDWWGLIRLSPLGPATAPRMMTADFLWGQAWLKQ